MEIPQLIEETKTSFIYETRFERVVINKMEPIVIPYLTDGEIVGHYIKLAGKADDAERLASFTGAPLA